MARPRKYTKAVGDRLCAALIEGKSLRSACKQKNMPGFSTVCRWLADEQEYPEFRDQYARARAIQAELLADEIQDIADDAANDWMESNDPKNPGYTFNGEHVQRSRLRVEARKWTASKLLPKRYGDRITNNLVGENDGPIETKSSVDFSKATAEQLRALAALAPNDR